jgi:hypothetical protein
MNDLRQAAEMALKYFEDAHGLEDAEAEIKEALRQALAQPEREWIGLTEEDFYKKDDELVFVLGMKFAAARLKEKNT